MTLDELAEALQRLTIAEIRQLQAILNDDDDGTAGIREPRNPIFDPFGSNTFEPISTSDITITTEAKGVLLYLEGVDE